MHWAAVSSKDLPNKLMKQKNPLSSSSKRGLSGSLLSLIICMVASVTFFTMSTSDIASQPLLVARSIAQTAVSPIRNLTSILFMPFSALKNLVKNATAPSELLTSLQNQNESLTAELTKLKEEQSEAERLQALLGFKSAYALEGTGARVIAGSVDSYNSTITIDKGANAGFTKGMAVTDSKGVVGEISEVSATTSVVRLITDERSGVSAQVQTSRAQGQIEGQGSLTLKMDMVRVDQQVQTGDMIVTSGLGGVYPKGLPIGMVTNVDRPQGAMYYTISVRPLASVGNLEEVFVITSLNEGQLATSSDVAIANQQNQ